MKKHYPILTSDLKMAIQKAMVEILEKDHVIASDVDRATLQLVIERAVLARDGCSTMIVSGPTGRSDLEVEYFSLGNNDGLRIAYRMQIHYLRLCADK